MAYRVELANNLGVRLAVEADAPAMARHANDREIAKQMRDSFPYPYSEDNAKAFIAICRDRSNWKQASADVSDPHDLPATADQELIPTTYVITLHDEVIGGIGLKFSGDTGRRTAEVGYWVARAFWNKGFASAILPAFVQWAFNTWSYLIRVEAHVYSTASASGKVLEKAGFKHEGTHMAAVFKFGRILDLKTYGLVRFNPI